MWIWSPSTEPMLQCLISASGISSVDSFANYNEWVAMVLVVDAEPIFITQNWIFCGCLEKKGLEWEERKKSSVRRSRFSRIPYDHLQS